MKRAPSDPATRRRRIDPLDTDLLGALEERDQRLYAIVSNATRYRRILTEQVKRLRMGDDPQLARGILTRWDHLLREIQRLAADLWGAPDPQTEGSMKGIAKRLREELDDTMGRIRRMGGGVVFEEFPGALEANTRQADQVDGSRLSEERETISATRHVLIDKANKLAEALQRLERGEYGSCEECGEPIGLARLRVTPEATTCVQCQRTLERSARRLQQDPTQEAD